MRNQINKLIKGHSTKSERRFLELLKESKIPFKTKVMIRGREVDFLIGNMVIEIDGHTQDVLKNKMLIEEGFHPVHFFNWEIDNPLIKPILIEWLQQIWQEQDYSPQAQTQV